ncbi:MAG: branched-chain amino acid ABC transporter permease [Candidatus Bathyarchaeia archaeon]
MVSTKYMLFLIVVIFLVLSQIPLLENAYLISFFQDFFCLLLIAQTWAVFSGLTGYTSLAGAAFFGIGAYASVLFPAPLPARIMISGLFSVIAGLPIALLTLRLRGLHFVVLTFIYNLFLQHFFANVVFAGRETSGILVPVISAEIAFYSLLILNLAGLLVSLIIHRSFWGYALSCIGQDEIKAESIGINTTFYKISMFLLHTFFVGAVGSVRILRMFYIEPAVAFSLRYSFEPLIAAIMGGAATFIGPIIGTAIIQVIARILIFNFPEYYFLILGVLMIVFICYKPEGIFGVRLSK